MKRILLAAAGLAFILTLVQPSPAQDLASSLVGVWQLKSPQDGLEVVVVTTWERVE